MLDRVCQQAVVQVLEPIYEPTFWAERRDVGSIDEALAGPAAGAPSTMPVGTLRQLCREDVPTRCADALKTLVTAGVRCGFDR